MSSHLQDPRDTMLNALVGALARRSVDVDAATLSDALREALREASGLTSEPLSSSERAFLLEHTDLEEQDLTDEARDITRARVLIARRRAGSVSREDNSVTDEENELR